MKPLYWSALFLALLLCALAAPANAQEIDPFTGQPLTLFQAGQAAPEPAALRNFARGAALDVLWDTSHGIYMNEYDPEHRYSNLAAELSRMGYSVTTSDAGVLAHNLANFDILVVCLASAYDSAYTAAEADAIETFVKNGGGLFIMSDNPGTHHTNLDAVTQRFGVLGGQGGGPIDHLSVFLSQPIFDKISTVYFISNGELSVNSPSIPAMWAAADHSGAPIAAVAEVELGRVVTLGDLNFLENQYLDDDANLAFGRNIFHWLAPTSYFFLSHLTGADTNWEDILEIDNLGASQAAYTIILYDQGVQVAMDNGLVESQGYAAIYLKSLVPEGSVATCGVISTDSANLRFRLTYESLLSGGSASFPVSGAATANMAAYFANDSSATTWKGVAFMNTGDVEDDYHLYALGKISDAPLTFGLVGVAEGTIGPLSRVAGWWSDFFPGVPLAKVEKIIIQSDTAPMSGISISGNNDGSILLFAPGDNTAWPIYAP